MLYKFILGSFLWFSILSGAAQTYHLRGKVTDSQNEKPLPFVTITFDREPRETVSDPNGEFAIDTEQPITQLTAHHSSYVSITLAITKQNYETVMLIKLGRKTQLSPENQILQEKQAQFQRPTYSPLTQRDSSIYLMIDSIEKANQRAEQLKMLEILQTGYIPFGPINLDYQKIIGYSKFEGLRLGFGLLTNQNVSNYCSFGGYATYGFHDKKWKNGASLQLFPSWYSETKLILSYRNDETEVGGYSFLDEYKLTSSEIYRNILINRMLFIQEKEAEIRFRILKYVKISFYLNNAVKKIPNYVFTPSAIDYDSINSTFHFTEVGLNLKFAYKEKIVSSPSGGWISKGSSYPILWFNLRKGISNFGGNFSYTKYELKVYKAFKTPTLGVSQFVLVSGKTVGDIPITNLYNGHASYSTFGIDAENSFATMRMNEFYATDFASLFFKQNFGRIWIDKPMFHPGFAWITNVGFGKLSNTMHHRPVTLNSFGKGYYESGVLINNLLSGNSFIGLGFGIYYRYGSYSYAKTSDNFCYRLTIDFNLN